MITDIRPFTEILNGIDWLAHVVSEFDASAGLGTFRWIRVATWSDALDKRGSDASSNAFMEAKGRLTRHVGLNHRVEYRKWNEMVFVTHELLEEEVFPNVRRRVAAITELSNPEEDQSFLERQVIWDVIGYVMEQVYSDRLVPAFYTALIKEVYPAGRFPCHWDEVWPDGRLWVL